jgi:hypothetical protein
LDTEGLKEAERADSSSLVGYAARLKEFPGRVEKLQRKLEVIQDRLKRIKGARVRADTVELQGSATADPIEMASPLF